MSTAIATRAQEKEQRADVQYSVRDIQYRQRGDKLEKRTANLKPFRVLSYISSAINLVLALSFFPLVPLVGWLNFGHGNWATAWIPDVVLLQVLPAGYFIYWHFWFVAAVPALLGSLYWFKRSGDRKAKVLAVANAGAVVVYWVVRIALGALGIRPDIV
jgi:hypothetical protein